MTNFLLTNDLSANSYDSVSYDLHGFKNEQCASYMFHCHAPVIHVKNMSSESNQNLNNTFVAIVRFNTSVAEVWNFIQELIIDLIVMGTKDDKSKGRFMWLKYRAGVQQ